MIPISEARVLVRQGSDARPNSRTSSRRHPSGRMISRLGIGPDNPDRYSDIHRRVVEMIEKGTDIQW